MSTVNPGMSRVRAGPALLLIVVATTVLTAHGAPQPSLAKADLTAACGTTNPYLAVARFAAAKNYRLDADAPSVVALRDTAADDVGSQVTLATQGQTGAVFGLAYDAGRGQIYASAYHKRGAPFGPGGTGGIYRIDLAAGTVRTLTSLQGGLDRHDLKDRDDELAGLWVGRASLGDIDLAPDGSQLFVANLFDGKVYRLRLPDGAVLGSFRHGGYGTTWQRDARLFALAADERWLYHGVMDMGRVAQRPATAHIFRSDWNGSALEEVTQFEAGVAMADEGNPEPGTLLFTDMELIPSALPGVEPGILAAFRDRLQDRQVSPLDAAGFQAPVFRWSRAEGAVARAYTVNAQGGLAAIPGIHFWTLSAWGRSRPAQRGSVAPLNRYHSRPDQLPSGWQGELNWLDAAAAPLPAAPFAIEPATEAVIFPSSIALRAGLGDVEALCPWRSDRDPALAAAATADVVSRQTAAAAVPQTAIAATAAAFATRFGPTLTAFVSATPRPPASTPSAAAGVRERILASCQGDEPAYAMSIFAREDSLAVLRRNDAVLAFDGKPADQLRLADQSQIGAVYGLAYDHRRTQLYAAAYVKRDAALGVLGAGGIYRIDLPTGQVAAWAMLPAGPDLHNFGINDDQAIIPWVGWLGLGDIDLSEDGRELFAVNAFDGRIYRLGVPDGRLLGSFANGGSGESWAAGARPMGLGVWGDKLYHGVVNSGAFGGPNEAAIFVSERDGSAMRLVLRLDLGYRRNPSAWTPWSDQSSGGGRDALLSDIVVRRNGDLLLGLRDRRGDNGLVVGAGDLIIARQQGGQWVPDTSSGGEFYKDDLTHAEPLWGALALSPLGDRVVSSALDPIEVYSGGAVWFDNDSGQPGLKETLYHGFSDRTFGKVQGLGDVESLCAPPLIPTFTPAVSPTLVPPSATVTMTATPSALPTKTLTPTASATATRTATVTRTATATASPTATPVPRPIYLPDLSRGRCAASRRPLEVVLLMDTSLSMTGEKLAAAQKAATTFTGLLNLRAGGDQAAVISFDGAARLIRRLTTSRSGILAGLAELKPATGTRIDLGLQAARTELSSARVRTGADKVILLLTDGLPTAGTADEASEAASAARRLGIDLWAVGLGGDADPAFLRQLTGSAGRVRVAPGARDLEAVFKQVAGALTCR